MEPDPRGTPAVVLMRPYERWGAAVSHLSTIVPLWAIVANALIYFAYSQKSRVVCLHARQGINFQLMFLLVFIAKCMTDLFARLLAAVDPLGAFPVHVRSAGTHLLSGVFVLYAAVCVIGAVQALRGRIFVYPLAGGRLYRNYLEARLSER